MFACSKILIVLVILALSHQNVQAACQWDGYWSCCTKYKNFKPSGYVECNSEGGLKKVCPDGQRGDIDNWRYCNFYADAPPAFAQY